MFSAKTCNGQTVSAPAQIPQLPLDLSHTSELRLEAGAIFVGWPNADPMHGERTYLRFQAGKCVHDLSHFKAPSPSTLSIPDELQVHEG